MATAPPSNKPIDESQLITISREACDSTLGLVSSYVHTQTEAWNTSIIHKILEALVATAQTSSSSDKSKPQYKYVVNSTIIQHIAEPSTNSVSTGTGPMENGSASTPVPELNHSSGAGASSGVISTDTVGDAASITPGKGRRGMHSATGAYWNNDADGMWNYKWEGGEQRGMDVVLCIIWVVV